jgi:cell division septation protein DedD
MEVAAYFKEYFLSKGKLFIPEFGEFKGMAHASYHDRKSGMMIPPRRDIIFNPEVREGDNEFIKYFAQKERVTEHEAVNIIKDYAEECGYQIAKGRRLEIPGIGLFFKSPEGKVVYEPDQSLLTTNEFYGLEAIPAPKQPKRSFKSLTAMVSIIFFILIVFACIGTLMHYGIIKPHPSWLPLKEQQSSGNDSLSAETNEVAKEVKPSEETRSNTDEATATYQQNPVPQDNTSVPAEKVQSVPETQKPVKTTAEPVKEKPKQATAEKAAKESPGAKVAKPEIKVNETPSSSLYYVVGGCFKMEEGARRFAQELKSKGYASEIFGKTSGGLNMVCYNSFPDKAAAMKLLEKIRKEENKSAYIYHKQ